MKGKGQWVSPSSLCGFFAVSVGIGMAAHLAGLKVDNLAHSIRGKESRQLCSFASENSGERRVMWNSVDDLSILTS